MQDSSRHEQVEISIDGDRVALIDVDPWLSYADPWGIAMRTDEAWAESDAPPMSPMSTRGVVIDRYFDGAEFDCDCGC